MRFKKKLRFVVVLGIFLTISLNCVIAEENSSFDGDIFEVINLSLSPEDDSNEGNVTFEVINLSLNESLEVINESIDDNKSVDDIINETLNETEDGNFSDNLTVEDPVEEINESVEINETIEVNDTLEVNESFLFALMDDMFFGIMGALANSTNYRLDVFLLGIHAISVPWQGDDLLIFTSFSDGKSGSASSTNYRANIGPLGTFTGYEQCYRKTCSELGYTCNRWEDSCEGYLHCGDCASDNSCFTGFCKLDEDHDMVPDAIDSLIGQVDDLEIVGLANINITVNGSSVNGTFSGVQDVVISSGSDIVVEFAHNFSGGAINFNELYIEETTDAIIVNFANELLSGETKTVYIYDHEFVDLCVEDAEIASIDDISPGCNGAGEIDFEGCIGNGAGHTIGAITCTDLGSRIKVEGLSHSGIEGLYFHPSEVSSGGGNICIYEEAHNWGCLEWSECIDGKQTRTCDSYDECRNVAEAPETERDCGVPGLLLDITFELEEEIIFVSDGLEAVITFDPLEDVSTAVDLTFIILDENGVEIYRGSDEITVTTKEVFRKNFVGLNLPDGEYTFVFSYLYGDDIQDEFIQKFTIGGRITITGEVVGWVFNGGKYWVGGILAFIVLIVSALLLGRRKRRIITERIVEVPKVEKKRIIPKRVTETPKVKKTERPVKVIKPVHHRKRKYTSVRKVVKAKRKRHTHKERLKMEEKAEKHLSGERIARFKEKIAEISKKVKVGGK
jgi:hypothetical protein